MTTPRTMLTISTPSGGTSKTISAKTFSANTTNRCHIEMPSHDFGELNNGHGRIGKYTLSGAPINPSLITGFGSFNAIAIVPEPSPGALLMFVGGIAAVQRMRRRALHSLRDI